ncbi:hypothetical protein BSKO_10423 [Bryopsis sp. KO-2023]|nr:hypothetical protein BSKO_10423 [Bryopsis sp. KO-2023]
MDSPIEAAYPCTESTHLVDSILQEDEVSIAEENEALLQESNFEENCGGRCNTSELETEISVLRSCLYEANQSQTDLLDRITELESTNQELLLRVQTYEMQSVDLASRLIEAQGALLDDQREIRDEVHNLKNNTSCVMEEVQVLMSLRVDFDELKGLWEVQKMELDATKKENLALLREVKDLDTAKTRLTVECEMFHERLSHSNRVKRELREECGRLKEERAVLNSKLAGSQKKSNRRGKGGVEGSKRRGK